MDIQLKMNGRKLSHKAENAKLVKSKREKELERDNQALRAQVKELEEDKKQKQKQKNKKKMDKKQKNKVRVAPRMGTKRKVAPITESKKKYIEWLKKRKNQMPGTKKKDIVMIKQEAKRKRQGKTLKQSDSVALATRHEHADVYMYQMIGPPLEQVKEKGYRYVIGKHDGMLYRSTKPHNVTTKSIRRMSVWKKLSDFALRYTYRTIPRGGETRIEREERERQFDLLVDIIKTDEDFNFQYMHYVDMIFVGEVEYVNQSKKKAKKIAKKSLDLSLFDSNNNGAIHSPFIEYSVHGEAETFGNIFKHSLNAKYQGTWLANSCFVMAIHAFFSPHFRATLDDKSVIKKGQMDIGWLAELLGFKWNNCGIENNQDLGLSIRQAVDHFFKRFKLGLVVIDRTGEVTYTYKPEQLNTNVKPGILYICVHNNHVYVVNKHIPSLEQRATKKDANTQVISIPQARDTYCFRVFNNVDEEDGESEETDKNIQNVTIFVSNTEDIMNGIKDNVDAKRITFVYNGNMNDLLCQMVHEHKYTPSVSYSSGKIIMISAEISDIKISIHNGDISCPGDAHVNLTEDNYETYNEVDKGLYETVINKKHMSTYNSKVIEFEDKYRMKPAFGYLTKKCPDKSYHGIDCVKAYSTEMRDITSVPVYTYFDKYKDYDGHTIEDYTKYFVHCKYNKADICEVLLFPAKYSIALGFKLKEARRRGYGFDITHFMRPSRLADTSDFKQAVDDVYAADINTMIAKHIVNKTTGLCEKRENKRTKTYVYSDFVDAQVQQLKSGGKIRTIQHSSMKHDFAAGDDDMQEIEHSVLFATSVNTKNIPKPVHILEIGSSAKLVESFMPIKEIIYERMAMRMCRIFDDVVSAGLIPIAIKTDCIMVNGTKEIISDKFTFENKLGGLKLEGRKFWTKTGARFMMDFNELHCPDVGAVNNIVLADEWNVKEIHSVIDKFNRLYIWGDAGCGKSFGVQSYGDKDDILYVCPGNALGDAINFVEGIMTITPDKLFGTLLGQVRITKDQSKRVMPLDVSGYKVIVFDEVFMHNETVMRRIARFADKNPDKKIICIGDPMQNKPIDPRHTGDDETYEEEEARTLKQIDMVQHICPNAVNYEIFKRVDTEEERQALTEIKTLIRDRNNKDIFKSIKKYFKIITDIKDIETTKNITLFKKRASDVNAIVNQRVNGYSYEKYFKTVGNEVVCKDFHKIGKGAGSLSLNSSCLFVIEQVLKTSVILKKKACNKGTLYNVTNAAIKAKFDMPYARTGYSVQGMTIREKMTIFDANMQSHVSRNWLWTAITRSSQPLKNITLFEHSKAAQKEKAMHRKVRYMRNKISGYMKQDEKAGRDFDKPKLNETGTPIEDNDPDSYVSLKWCFQRLKAVDYECEICRIPFEFKSENGRMLSNFTIDRKLDNSKAHLKSNCQLLCRQCNCTKH